MQRALESDAGEVQISQVLEGAQQLWRMTTPWEMQPRIPAEIKVLQMLQRKQRQTYLATQSSLKRIVIPLTSNSKSKTKDMASTVAAPDTPPSAAVVASPPRGEPAQKVSDASFERQQSVTLLAVGLAPLPAKVLAVVSTRRRSRSLVVGLGCMVCGLSCAVATG